MEFKTFFVRKVLVSFFVAVTGICAGMAVIGMQFDPGAQFGYEGFLSPLIFGAATMLLTLAGYSKRELSVREVLIRRIIQLVLIESVVLLLIYSSGGLVSIPLTVSLALTVLLVYVTVHLVLWANDRKTAEALNEALRRMQQNKSD